MHRRRPLSLALVVAAMSIVVASGTALADTEFGHSGRVGPHNLRDSNRDGGYRGATCAYDTTAIIRAYKLIVKAPSMRARNRTAGTDRQYVGYRVRLQRAPRAVPTTWTTIAISPLSKVYANDVYATHFPAAPSQVFAPTMIRDHWFRAVISMYWYAPGTTSTVEGGATHRVDYYDYVYSPSITGGPRHNDTAGYCESEIGR